MIFGNALGNDWLCDGEPRYRLGAFIGGALLHIYSLLTYSATLCA
jgi:hypothetical protein